MTAATLVELRPGVVGGRFTVAVAELTGFTAIRRFLDIPHLERVIASFDRICHEVLASRAPIVIRRGRDRTALVYAMASPVDAVSASEALIAAVELDDLLPPVRAGVASGTVLVAPDRCYGPAVDLAFDHMTAARPGEVAFDVSERALSEVRPALA